MRRSHGLLALTVVCFLAVSLYSRGQEAPGQRGGAQGAVDPEIVGIPWSGEPGVTEDVRDITARDVPSARGSLIEVPRRVDAERKHRPQNPDSPRESNLAPSQPLPKAPQA